MAFEFKFPDVGEGIVEGLLVKWLVKEGETVKEDQAIVEIETDKAVVEVPSPKAGVILKRFHKENETIRVGEVLVTIGEAGEKTESTIEPKKVARQPSVVGDIKEELEFKTVAAASFAGGVLPYIRQLAKELKVDLTLIHGTGAGGRISEDDVRRAAQAKTAGEAEKYGPVERVPFAGVRKSISERLLRTTTSVAMVTHFDMADVSELDSVRGKLSYLPFFIRAITRALKDLPAVNSSLDESTQEIIYKKYYNIGIAVDTEHGLIVPVIKNADGKKINELAEILSGIAERTRDRTVDLEELRGGTFTISNVGMVGGLFATPIMPYPQSAILAIGRIKEFPVVKNKKIVIGKQAPLSLSFDHRLIDGADAARFVNRIIDEISKPKGLL